MCLHLPEVLVLIALALAVLAVVAIVLRSRRRSDRAAIHTESAAVHTESAAAPTDATAPRADGAAVSTEPAAVSTDPTRSTNGRRGVTSSASPRYGFLGPEGTFTQMALLSWAEQHPTGEHRPYASVDAALAAVRDGEIDAAIVPIENSVEGGVSATLDALSHGGLVIIGEVTVPITFVLAAATETPLSQIRTVGTHSHAWAQVRGWMETNLPDATYVPTLSTAAAAVDLTQSAPHPYDAAVCAPIAADTLGLVTLARDIGDEGGAITRFVVVAQPGSLPERTGADKTTVVLYQRHNHAGALLALLEQFAVRGINMTRLESRPTKVSLGSYCFSIDIEGHVLDERVGEALMGLKRASADLRFLGSYPREDGVPAGVAEFSNDDDFVAARSWLQSLREA